MAKVKPDFEFEGFEETARLLNELLDFPKAELLRVVEAGLELLAAEAAMYPPAPPGSSYRRTGTLGRRWLTARHVIQASPIGVSGRVGNNTRYGRYVMDPTDQAEIHAGRWRTTEQVAEARRRDIEKLLERAEQRIEERFNAQER